MIRRGERGFALLVVLWTAALLGLLGAQLAARARAESGEAQGARAAATLEAAADGGIQAAIFHLLCGDWAADSRPRAERFGPLGLTTTIANEAGRINPNSGPVVLLTALLRVLGEDSRHAGEIALAMADWRAGGAAVTARYRAAGLAYGPGAAPFQSLDEIGLVPGVTPDLLARMKPHLSLFQQGDVEARFADPQVLAALRLAGPAGTPWRALHVHIDDLLVRVTVVASAAGERRFTRSAEVRFPARPDAGAADYAILSWDSGGS